MHNLAAFLHTGKILTQCGCNSITGSCSVPDPYQLQLLPLCLASNAEDNSIIVHKEQGFLLTMGEALGSCVGGGIDNDSLPLLGSDCINRKLRTLYHSSETWLMSNEARLTCAEPCNRRKNV